MNLYGYYVDGTLIATGTFGNVYVVPFEGSIAAIVKRAGQSAYEYLSRERLAKLIAQGTTLKYTVEFSALDLDSLASETYLNTSWGRQGGWSLTNNDADGQYTQYTKPFTGYRITNSETRIDETQDVLMAAVVALANQPKPHQYTGVRKVWNDLTGL